MFEPAYVKLLENGGLRDIADRLYKVYDSCKLCPRDCLAGRSSGALGVCSASATTRVCSAHPHFGEERPLVGRGGSGTIFFSHCNLLCLYCQNWDISHSGEGSEISDKELASLMLKLQKTGCHNINVVTPTHYLPNIVQALVYAAEKGLRLPLVYNTGNYDHVEILKMLDGVVDIYLPDYKYSDGAVAAKFSKGAKDYPEKARAALKEMHRQVGILQTDDNGIALRGLMIRHLVLPNGLAGSEAFLKFVAEELDRETYVNIMAQYRPCHRAHEHEELAEGLSNWDYQQAVVLAKKYKLTNLD